jgi:hypothetical protein
VDEDVHVLNIAHPALISVHAFQIARRISRQEWQDHLGHVPEFLERDANTVNARRLFPIHLIVRARGARVRIVHGLKRLHGKNRLARLSLQYGPDPLYALAMLRRFGIAYLLAGGPPQTTLLFLQVPVE